MLFTFDDLLPYQEHEDTSMYGSLRFQDDNAGIRCGEMGVISNKDVHAPVLVALNDDEEAQIQV